MSEHDYCRCGHERKAHRLGRCEGWGNWGSLCKCKGFHLKQRRNFHHWDDTSHYHMFPKPVTCSCCKGKYKRMRRINSPHATSDKQRQKVYPDMKGYPHTRYPYNDWRCTRCWNTCPSMGKCRHTGKRI